MNFQTSAEKYTIENILHLLDIYRAEWEHRETILWRQNFKFFYATLIVSLLPNLEKGLGIELSIKLPAIIYPIIGIGLSFIFLYVAIGGVARLEAINNTYQKIIGILPQELQREKVMDLEIIGKNFFHRSMGLPVSLMMFFALFIISLISAIFA